MGLWFNIVLLVCIVCGQRDVFLVTESLSRLNLLTVDQNSGNSSFVGSLPSGWSRSICTLVTKDRAHNVWVAAMNGDQFGFVSFSPNLTPRMVNISVVSPTAILSAVYSEEKDSFYFIGLVGRSSAQLFVQKDNLTSAIGKPFCFAGNGNELAVTFVTPPVIDSNGDIYSCLRTKSDNGTVSWLISLLNSTNGDYRTTELPSVSFYFGPVYWKYSLFAFVEATSPNDLGAIVIDPVFGYTKPVRPHHWKVPILADTLVVDSSIGNVWSWSREEHSIFGVNLEDGTDLAPVLLEGVSDSIVGLVFL